MDIQSPGAAYRLLSLLILPFWLLHAYLHGRKHALTGYLRHRLLGQAGRNMTPKLWVHASSVGEVNAITPLVKALFKQGESILFTSFTATGYQTIQRNFPNGIESGVIPIDFVFTCRRFFRRQKIKLCLLMETELWPELIYQAANHGVAIVQVNARLSKKSLEAPILLRYLLRRSLSNIERHLARNDEDRSNLIHLGAEPQRIKIIGNLKSHIEQTDSPQRLVDRDYILFASSHEGEEQRFLLNRPDNWKKRLIVIAPRHPKRSRDIQRQLIDLGINFAVRSEGQPVTGETEVYLSDTLGELRPLMAHAEVVIMAGSFDQTGGHNLIEPASLGCAIITGPSSSNITDDIEQLGDGIIRVTDIPECWRQVDHLSGNPNQRKILGEKARESVRRNSDMLIRYIAEIKPYL